jgi:hypothetical protein
MSRASRERDRIAKRDAKKNEELVLPMGRPNNCYENAMAAVIANPKRLLYVEGFYITEGSNFIHHGWVKDRATGKRHEVTISDADPDAVYIGKEFKRDELYSPFEGSTIESADEWAHQLTIQDEYDMLSGAGYDVSLSRKLLPEDGTPEVYNVPLDSIDMSLNEEALSYKFKLPSMNGWELQWELKSVWEENGPVIDTQETTAAAIP